MNTPKTTWIQPKLPDGEYRVVPRPKKPIHGKGETKYDNHFDRMRSEDVAIVVPTDEVSIIKKAFHRYATNKRIVKDMSFRQMHNKGTRTHTVWVEKRVEKKE